MNIMYWVEDNIPLVPKSEDEDYCWDCANWWEKIKWMVVTGETHRFIFGLKLKILSIYWGFLDSVHNRK